MAGLTHQQRREKADNTKATALEIISKEQSASDAKVAKLKALRLARKVPARSEPSPIPRRAGGETNTLDGDQ